MQVHATAAGLWLIGVGSLLAATPRLIRAPRPELGLAWESLGRRIERLHYACETIGLLLVAAGSVTVAIAETQPWWFIVGILALAIVAVWAVAAHKQRQLWQMRTATATDYPRAEPPLATAADQRRLATERARWSYCLRRAFEPDVRWPPLAETMPEAPQEDRLERHDIVALRVEDERLETLAIPSSIAHDVELIREQGIRVTVSGDLIVATAPNGGTAQASRTALGTNSAAAVLARDRFIGDLEKLGLKTRIGARGQLHPAGAPAWQIDQQDAGPSSADTGVP